MKYKAVESVATCPDGFSPFHLVEGREYENLDPSTLDFLLKRKLVVAVLPMVKRETKPAPKATRVTKKKKVTDAVKGNNSASD